MGESDALFSAPGIMVTRNVAIFGQHSYQIANIGSIETRQKQFSSWQYTLTWGIGLVVSLGALAISFGLALMLFFLTIIVAAMVRSQWPGPVETTLVFKTSSGDIQAFKSMKGAEVDAVKDAMHKAFALRT